MKGKGTRSPLSKPTGATTSAKSDRAPRNGWTRQNCPGLVSWADLSWQVTAPRADVSRCRRRSSADERACPGMARSRLIDLLQQEPAEGPALATLWDHDTVYVPDLTAD